MNKLSVAAALFTLAMMSSNAATANADAQGKYASSSADSGKPASGKAASGRQESSATLIGKNGLMRVDGDTIEARNGHLTVNGMPYGEVQDKSVIRYTAKGKEKTLTVDGVARNPSPAR